MKNNNNVLQSRIYISGPGGEITKSGYENEQSLIIKNIATVNVLLPRLTTQWVSKDKKYLIYNLVESHTHNSYGLERENKIRLPLVYQKSFWDGISLLERSYRQIQFKLKVPLWLSSPILKSDLTETIQFNPVVGGYDHSVALVS